MLSPYYILKKLRLQLFYHSFKGSYKMNLVLPPKYVIWDCTRRCNLDCKHCGAKREIYQKELSSKVVRRIIDELATYKVKYFMVTGGEPLLREDLFEIFTYAKLKGLMTGLATNGFFINKKNIQKIVNIFDSVQVSLDGIEKHHNEIRGNSLAFQKAVNAIKLLKKFKCRQVSVSSVISPININNFEDIAVLLYKLKVVYWKVVSVMPIGKLKKDKCLYLNTKDFLHLLNLTKKCRNKYKGELKIEFGENLGYLGRYDSKVRDEPFFCPVGFLSCCIGVDGTVRGCPEQPDIDVFQEGNILNQKFSHIWEKGFIKYRTREFLKDKKCKRCNFKKNVGVAAG